MGGVSGSVARSLQDFGWFPRSYACIYTHVCLPVTWFEESSPAIYRSENKYYFRMR